MTTMPSSTVRPQLTGPSALSSRSSAPASSSGGWESAVPQTAIQRRTDAAAGAVSCQFVAASGTDRRSSVYRAALGGSGRGAAPSGRHALDRLGPCRHTRAEFSAHKTVSWTTVPCPCAEWPCGALSGRKQGDRYVGEEAKGAESDNPPPVGSSTRHEIPV
jgi:hypothetical protein